MIMPDLSTLIQLKDNPTETGIRRYLTMGPCCILAAAIDTPDALEPARELVGRLSSSKQLSARLSARVDLMEVYHGPNAGDEDIQRAIQQVIAVTEADWCYQRTPEMADLDRRLQAGNSDSPAKPWLPSVLSTLVNRPNQKSPPELQRWVQLFREIAADQKIGWTHPGLLLAGGMISALVAKQLPVPEYSTETVLMFAAHHPTHPCGVVARLTMQRIPGGCGLLIPDPLRCGYQWMSDPTFARGLQNALHAARGYVTRQPWSQNVLDFDWMWSLDLLHARANLPEPLRLVLQIPIQGRSAELALTCAMIATARGNPDGISTTMPLDPQVGATASLDTQSAAWKNADFTNLPLTRVDSIDDKTILGRMESVRLRTVVVAENQPDGSLPTDSRYEFSKQPTLQAAYDAMVRLPRISRAVNRAISHRATKLLNELCQPYVKPALAWEPTFEDQRLMLDQNADPKVKLKQLTDAQFQQLCSGQLKYTVEPLEDTSSEDQSDSSEQYSDDSLNPNVDGFEGNRIWICAESGLGKSMFILFCQKRIAESDSGLVAIRLGRTSDQDFALSSISSWQTLTPETLVQLPEVIGFLDAAFPPNTEKQLSNPERLEWFCWLWKNGQIAFLLDALDQTDRDMQDLGHFLQNGDARRCCTIMTGRPESLTNQAKAFRGALAWTNLRLLPFDRPRQVQYLGEELAERLLPKKDEIDWQTSNDPEELRRHHWKDLLEVPLLLCLLRTLATEQGSNRLEGITSKYDLYNRAVDHLIDQAPIKIEDHSLLKKIQGDERELLEEIAWSMIQASDTTNQLVGKMLQPLRKQFKDKYKDAELLDIIARVNIATLYQILEPSASGGQQEKKVEALAFRHRSILEFFAGCYFAKRLNEQEQEAVLIDIHAMLDEHGEIRKELLPNQDRPAIWQETLRFALSAVDNETRDRLARRLIELGNPWIVYQSIRGDHVKYFSAMELVVCRLVHQNWNRKFDFRTALQTDEPNLRIENDQQAIAELNLSLRNLTNRSTRDALWLSPLRDLVRDQLNHIGYSNDFSLLERIHSLRNGWQDVPTWNYFDSFVWVPGGTFDFSRYHHDFLVQTVHIPDLFLADFPVTNELFELFCPSHRRWRDQYSLEDDQPVLHVNWYMANEFCLWLSALTGQQYRLPTEWEWEWSCRWLCDRKKSSHADARHWWGPIMDDSLCWYDRLFNGNIRPTKLESRTRGRREAIEMFAIAEQQHPSWRSVQQPGLLDLLGNVWEWCENSHSLTGLVQVYRGGSWVSRSQLCWSSNRLGSKPADRNIDLSFRVALVPSGQESSQSSEQSLGT